MYWKSRKWHPLTALQWAKRTLHQIKQKILQRHVVSWNGFTVIAAMRYTLRRDGNFTYWPVAIMLLVTNALHWSSRQPPMVRHATSVPSVWKLCEHVNWIIQCRPTSRNSSIRSPTKKVWTTFRYYGFRLSITSDFWDTSIVWQVTINLSMIYRISLTN